MDASEGDVNGSPRRQAWSAGLDSETRALLERDRGVFMDQSLSTPCLDVIDGVGGAGMTTQDGRRLIDLHGNSLHQVGYGHPRVLDAIRTQLDTLSFCPRRFTNRVAIEFAERLVDVSPSGLRRVLFAPGGAEAVSMALKIARFATGRFKTLSWWNSFHGCTMDAISVGGEGVFRHGLGPLMPGAIRVPPPDGSVPGTESLDSLRYIEHVMEMEGDIGCVITEPLRSTTVRDIDPEFWAGLRACCDRHGALLIFDEIPLCLGRTGAHFACERTGIEPDMLVIGKGLGGGVLPIAAVLCREDLDIAGDVSMGHFTHEKSPVCCAAGLATLEVIEEEGLVERAHELGSRMHGRALESGAKAVRTAGAMTAIELERADEAERVMYESLERGVSFKIGAGTNLVLSPALTIGREDLDLAMDVVVSAVRSAVPSRSF